MRGETWIVEDGYLKQERADDPHRRRFYLFKLEECAGLGREAKRVYGTLAAAPELLAALELFMEQYHIEGDSDREQRPEIKAALAAIAKAKG